MANAQTETLMALGPYRYSIATAALTEQHRIFEYRWADINVVNSKPRSHFIGPGLIQWQQMGSIYPFYRGGFDQVDQIAAEAQKGSPLRLVDGLGYDWGLFTIRKISDQQNVRFKGKPTKITFKVELIEYAG